MGKYDGIKNPDLTDSEYEDYRAQARAKASHWLAVNDGTKTGNFLGYWACPKCSKGRELVRPESGDLEIICECGERVVLPLVQSKTLELSEGALL